ncbi:RHS repeat-associated core domain-containing protein [Deltaproteobacteria bacterium TL4]
MRSYLETIEDKDHRQRVESDLNRFNGFLLENKIRTLKEFNDALAKPEFVSKTSNFIKTSSETQTSSYQRGFLGGFWESLKGWLEYLIRLFKNFIEFIMKFLETGNSDKPPAVPAKGVNFLDTDPDKNQFSGEVLITKADDESELTHYVLYWGSDANTKLEHEPAIAALAKTGSDLSYAIAANTTIPQGATYLLVFTQNNNGEMGTNVKVALIDTMIELTFTAPADGSYFNTTTPELKVSYKGTGSELDISTLRFYTDNHELAVNCTHSESGSACIPTTPLQEGPQLISAAIKNKQGNSPSPAQVRFTVDTTPPTISLDFPTEIFTNQWEKTITGQVNETATLTVKGQSVSLGENRAFSQDLPLLEGLNTFELKAVDLAGNEDALTLNITLDLTPPSAINSGLITLERDSDERVSLSAPAGTLEMGASVTITNVNTKESALIEADQNGGFTAIMAAENGSQLSVLVTDLAGNVGPSTNITINLTSLPPDPVAVAPEVNLTTVTTLASATEFLYTGGNPIQRGVEPGTIEAKRAAVLRGKVMDREANPLPGVTITILDHPEYGKTLTRKDGMFDLAVNGGLVLTVNYAKENVLPARKQIHVPWQDYVLLEEVILLAYDAKVTTIDLDSNEPFQVAQGSPVTDEDGTRQATLLFPQKTNATMTLPDGTTQPLTTLHLRVTEYTVGPHGPKAMPAPLPPSSGYTYAVELSVDEAEAAGAEEVLLDQPVYFYVENFLGFPVGLSVPTAYYSGFQSRRSPDPSLPATGCAPLETPEENTPAWIPTDDGRVIKILSINDGVAEIDIDGDDVADHATLLAELGVTQAEQRKLASLYQPGQTLWRVPMRHFSPYDMNYSMISMGPSPRQKPGHNTGAGKSHKKPCNSIIDCQNQTLGEVLKIPGSPFSLNYQSARVPGRKVGQVLTIPLSGTEIFPDLKSIELEVSVAGRQFKQTFPAEPDQSYTFEWDGKDVYGRVLQGRQKLRVRIGYVYPAFYQVPAPEFRSFDLATGIPLKGVPSRTKLTRWQEYTTEIGTWNTPEQKFGGWGLSELHAYDPLDQTLYLGNGEWRSARNLSYMATTVAENMDHIEDLDLYPTSIAVDGDDNLFIISWRYLEELTGNHEVGYRIYKLTPAGVLTIFEEGAVGLDDVGIIASSKMTVDGKGNLVSVMLKNRVDKLTPKGTLTTIAGACEVSGGENGKDLMAYLSGLAFDKQGNLFLVEDSQIKKLRPDGLMTTIVGTAELGYSGDEGAALNAQLNFPTGIALDERGNLFIADAGNHRIRKVTPDGLITTVAGHGEEGYSGDGGPAIEARMSRPNAVAVDKQGNLFIADSENGRIRKVSPDGMIVTIAGTGAEGSSKNGEPAIQTTFLPLDLALDSQDNLLVSDAGNKRILKISPALENFTGQPINIASEDGSQIYAFNATGKHLLTVNAATGATIYSFSYNAAGLLKEIKDGAGNMTQIERDDSGKLVTIVAPYGQRTTLKLDENGYLSSSTDPAGNTTQFTYTDEGLLTSFTDPKGNASLFTYDEFGRLIKDENAAGGFWSMTRTGNSDNYTITMTTAMERLTSYTVKNLPTGEQLRLNHEPGGIQAEILIGVDGSLKTRSPNGTVATSVPGPDPRWNMQSPIPKETTVATPGGLKATTTMERSVSLADPKDKTSPQTQTEIVSLNGRVYTTLFNTATKTAISTSPAGRQTVTVLDHQTRVLEFQAPGLEKTTYEYDQRGRLSVITQGDRVTTLTYGTDGYLASITDPLAHTVEFDVNANGWLTQQTLSDSRVIATSYDANGNTEALTPPGRDAHQFNYNPVNLIQAYTPPALSDSGVPASKLSTGYTYNLDKQIDRITRPDGKTIDFVYKTDPNDDLLDKIVIPRGEILFSYKPGTGQLKTITAPEGGTLSYTFDGFLLTKEEWSGTISGSVSQTYDNNFWITSRSVNGEYVINFQYDNDGLLTQAGDLTLSRNEQNGFLTGTTLSSVTTTQTYNTYGELKTYNAAFSGSTLFNVQYTRDKLGRITQKIETIEGQTDTYDYEYDLAGRLTNVKKNNVLFAHYEYDDNGNRLSYTGTSGTVKGDYDQQDRLLKYGDTTYTYTANGELKTKTVDGQTTTYEYDVLGNLMKVVLPDGKVIEYVIDGQNRRIGKKVNGKLVKGWLYKDQLNPVAEIDGSGKVVSRFVYGSKLNVPDTIIKEEKSYRVITDHLGSPKLIIDVSDGNVVQDMEYDAWGKILKDGNPEFQPFGFAGGLYDTDTQLVRFGARDYDPEVGRWSIKDPIGFKGNQTNLSIPSPNL